MKKIIIATGIALFAFQSFAQDEELGKAEKKQLKSEMKKLSPEEYKEMKSLSIQADEMQNQMTEMETENSQLLAENDEMKAELIELKAEMEEMKNNTVSTPQGNSDNYKEYDAPSSSSKGLVFKVQIGAYKGYDLREFIGKHKNFSGETDSDGTMRYTLGEFSEYWEADKLKQYLRKMGVKGAWVVPYKNGERVDIKDALEGAL